MVDVLIRGGGTLVVLVDVIVDALLRRGEVLVSDVLHVHVLRWGGVLVL